MCDCVGCFTLGKPVPSHAGHLISATASFDLSLFIKSALRKLIANDRFARYLVQYQPDLFIEFQKDRRNNVNAPSEAA
jgi:hypothetical protein